MQILYKIILILKLLCKIDIIFYNFNGVKYENKTIKKRK